ncbi:MAG: YggS family pyridoxal phosphate-dependent enzyme [Sphingorhabdus sp.]
MQDANTENTLETVAAKIARAAEIAQRKSGDIALIAVSKTRSAQEIVPLLKAGHRLFGENRVQEAAEKWPALKTEFPGCKLHLIGQLQSNKAADAVKLFDCIHSVDRMSLIKALGKAMREAERNIPVFLQVNIGAEDQKGGCAIGDIAGLLEAAGTNGIEVIGLMCLPPADVEPAPYFALLAQLAERNGLHALSMGMSGDYETAVRLGATHIRVGTALFGPRG